MFSGGYRKATRDCNGLIFSQFTPFINSNKFIPADIYLFKVDDV